MSAHPDGTDDAQPAWMRAAWAELGQRELSGAAANTHIIEMFQAVGHPEIHHDDVAWCAAFVGACLVRAGIASTRSLQARSYSTWGEAQSPPRLGSICVFSRGNDPALGHVGFWLGESVDGIMVLGGNQSHAVSVTVMPSAHLIACRWPVAAASPAVGSSAGGATAAQAPTPPPSTNPMFDVALAHVLELEGGYSNDPYDPGGPTNQGITLADYASYLDTPVTASNRQRLIDGVRSISPEVVREIYWANYWGPSHAGELPAGLGLMHFDTAVNQGLTGASRLLRTALGFTAGGAIDRQVLAAATTADIDATLERYAQLRRDRYRQLSHFTRFGRGWLRRVDTTLAKARQIAVASPAGPPIPEKHALNPGEKTMADGSSTQHANAGSQSGGQTGGQAGTPATKWWGNSMTIWGAMITGVSTVAPVLGPVLGIDLTPDTVHQIGTQSVQVVEAVGGLIGTVMTIYGRSRATMGLMRREVRLRL